MCFDPKTRTDVAAELADVGARVRGLLEAASRLTETEVVALGQRIQELNVEALGNRETLDGLSQQFEAGDVGGRGSLEIAVRHQERSVDTFVGRIRDELIRQNEASTGVVTVAEQIQRFVGSVETIAVNMRILTINAKLEAARWGAQGAPFATIAGGMRELTAEVQTANEQVGQLAQSLSAFVDQIVASERSTQSVVDRLADEMAARIRELLAAYESTRETTQRAVAAGTERADRLVKMSTGMLTHLQFQDRMAQTLAEVNAVLGAEHAFVDAVFGQAAANDNVDVAAAKKAAGQGLVRISRESELRSSDIGQQAGVVELF